MGAGSGVLGSVTAEGVAATEEVACVVDVIDDETASSLPTPRLPTPLLAAPLLPLSSLHATSSNAHHGTASSLRAGDRRRPAILLDSAAHNTPASVTVASSAHMSPTPLPIILDCDPGHDDAIAIVVAAHHTNLLGITTVAGNAPLDATTRNAIIVRDLLGLECPVHSGANRPLTRPARHAGYVHGESGMDGADLPPPSGPPASHDAVGYIIDTCRAHEGVWLVPTGPLTNIALALRAAPDLAGRLGGISLMGGGTFGNRTAAAEFNLWCDPEAADMVFTYGGPLIMSGLDLTHQFQALPQRIEAVRALPGHLAAVLADLFDFFSSTYRARHHHIAGAPVHDPCAVMALTHPHLFTRRLAHVEIETRGRLTAGMTVIDQRDLKEVPDANCDVLTGIDADAAWDVVVAAIASGGAPSALP